MPTTSRQRRGQTIVRKRDKPGATRRVHQAGMDRTRRRRGSSALTEVEANALRKRQLAAPIYGVGLTPHVGLPGVRARFASPAGVLLAAECAADLRSGSADVDVGDPAIAAGGGQKSFRALHAVGEQGGRQALRYAIVQRDRFLD